MNAYDSRFQRDLKIKRGDHNVADGEVSVHMFDADPPVYGLSMQEGQSTMLVYLTERELRAHLCQLEAAVENIEAYRAEQRKPAAVGWRPLDDDEVAAC